MTTQVGHVKIKISCQNNWQFLTCFSVCLGFPHPPYKKQNMVFNCDQQLLISYDHNSFIIYAFDIKTSFRHCGCEFDLPRQEKQDLEFNTTNKVLCMNANAYTRH
jgi:hypothetical protein